MTTRIAINGFGRIGRNFYRAVHNINADLDIVAINDLTDTNTLAHLLKYDSILGRFNADISAESNKINVGNKSIDVFSSKDPSTLPWKDLNIDIVIESTGFYTNAVYARKHLDAGAKKVIISAPAENEDTTIVMGINDDTYNPKEHHVISNASCTTNCLAPLAKIINDEFGIKSGLMTTLHAYTADQKLQDSPHTDMRRARAAALNIVPTSTGAAKAIGVVVPELQGKLDGFAMRVPVPTGSATDLTLQLKKKVSIQDINDLYKEAAQSSKYSKYLTYSEDPIVSSDIVTDPASCIFDAGLTRVIGEHAKVIGWYDNEWGYSNRMVDLALMLSKKL